MVARRWSTEAVKAAIAVPQARRLRDVEAGVHKPRAFDIADRLRRMGWQQTEPAVEDGFAAGQPRYVFQVPFAGRSLEGLQRGINQQWRPNIKKAEKAGVKVVQSDYEDLPAFYDIYVETAERGRFIPRPPAYFQRMWTALRGPWIPTACAPLPRPARGRDARGSHDADGRRAPLALLRRSHQPQARGPSARSSRTTRSSGG